MREDLGFWELMVILLVGILIATTIMSGNIKVPSTYTTEKTIKIIGYERTFCMDEYYNVYTTPYNINVGIHSHGGMGNHTVRINYVGDEKIITDIKIDGKWMSDIQRSEYEKPVPVIGKPTPTPDIIHLKQGYYQVD